MHVPDGFLDAPTSAATAVVAAGAVALSLRGARRELDEKTAPLAGLVAVFVFAAQMINFPVGAGTSGHLLGGVLAMVLVGPWTATLCLTAVLLVQALLFADGGITALGTNVTLMGVAAVWAGWAVLHVLAAALPRRIGVLPVVAGVAAWASVVTTSVVFTALFAVGGTAPVDPAAVLAAMVGWHAVIGIGEGAITALVVSAVLATRPDLVHAARSYLPERTLEIRDRSTAGAPA